jgi:hypothetical protein
MKDIAIDIQDLHYAAVQADDEEVFMKHVMDTGWVSPSEKEARAYQASRLLPDLSEGERIAVNRVLSAIGVNVPAVDLPVNSGKTA